MAKKKRRRLKKPIRRTLWGILWVLLLYLAWTCRGYITELLDWGKEEVVETVRPKEVVKPLFQEKIRFGRVDSAKVSMTMYDLTADTLIYQYQSEKRMAPASCMKILTAVTALKRLGLDSYYETRVVANGIVKGGTLYGNLILQGDYDPLLESFNDLVPQIRQHGIERVEGSVIMDLARRDTLRPHRTANRWDILYHKLPLMLRGETYIRRDFMYALSRYKISVKTVPSLASQVMGMDERDDAVRRRIAINRMVKEGLVVASQRNRFKDAVSPMLIHSSNIKAEAILWHVDNYLYRWGTAGYGVPVEPATSMKTFIREEMPEEDTMGFVINDGSGLSPENRLTTHFLVNLLRYAWRDEAMRNYLLDEGMVTPCHPTRHGSLVHRMRNPYYKGKIYCKTGTLVTVGTSALSGYAKGSNGHWYAFSIINEDTPVYEGRQFQDYICRLLIK